MGNSTSREAVVTMVIKKNPKKPYVVCKTTDEPIHPSKLPKGEAVTFSLSAYQGDHEPKQGQLVSLGDIEKFSQGWRAQTATPIRA